MTGFDPPFINSLASALKGIEIPQLCRFPSLQHHPQSPRTEAQGHFWVGPSSPPAPVTQSRKFISLISLCICPLQPFVEVLTPAAFVKTNSCHTSIAGQAGCRIGEGKRNHRGFSEAVAVVNGEGCGSHNYISAWYLFRERAGL